jgi:hypothetical protein
VLAQARRFGLGELPLGSADPLAQAEHPGERGELGLVIERQRARDRPGSAGCHAQEPFADVGGDQREPPLELAPLPGQGQNPHRHLVGGDVEFHVFEPTGEAGLDVRPHDRADDVPARPHPLLDGREVDDAEAPRVAPPAQFPMRFAQPSEPCRELAGQPGVEPGSGARRVELERSLANLAHPSRAHHVARTVIRAGAGPAASLRTVPGKG